MITHDRYQTAVYFGLPSVWTLNIITQAVVIVGGPFCICAADTYGPGAVMADTYGPGAVAAQGGCCE